MATQHTERTIKAYAAHKSGEPLIVYEYEASPLKATEVEVKIKACGVCASDVDVLAGKYDSFGIYTYPIVCGHEGVGEVTQVGANVSSLKLGDIVGLGVYRNCCGTCDYCAQGDTNVCPQSVMIFTLGNKGCFGEYVRIDARFAFPIPKELPVEYAAPLMCAGATVFAPFYNHNIRPGQTVGVIGIGGLGHLAIQIAKAYGCQVYAFSNSPAKEKECRHFGAHHFINMKDEASRNSAVGKLDYLLMTASGSDVNYAYYLNALKKLGTLVIMGAGGLTDIPVSPAALILGQRSVAGSAAGSIHVYKKMIEFCALHHIHPTIEKFEVKDINKAIERVRSGEVRYRAVIMF